MNALFGTLPVPTPETEHFWAGTRDGKLLLQRCGVCRQVYFPPRPFCPACASRDVAVFPASGRATLYSYSIDAVSAPDATPFAVAVVALEEGVRMMTNIVGVEPMPQALQLDMSLEVVFEPVSDTITLAKFRPADGIPETVA